MVGMAEPSDRSTGCGFLKAVFGRHGFWIKRSPSSGSLPPSTTTNSATATSKRSRSASTESIFLDSSFAPPPQPAVKPTPRAAVAASIPARTQPQQQSSKIQSRQGYGGRRKGENEAMNISDELESMIADHQKNKGSTAFVRASSSNLMVAGDLGNLRQSRNPRGEAVVMQTVGRIEQQQQQQQQGTSLCRALSTRMDPETLKIMGNEDYKNGRFADALALYDAAISIDANKASYRSNKSAALAALGRIIEAVFECREAIRIEPLYQRAHHRLGTLYLRLGEADKAVYHYKRAGAEADPDGAAKAQSLLVHLNKCTNARKQRDWNGVLKEISLAISCGADSAPQFLGLSLGEMEQFDPSIWWHIYNKICALQAEALLRLHRHDEADMTLSKGPKFSDDECIKVFGPLGIANLLLTRSQVNIAIGRFDRAVEEARRAVQLDPMSKEASMVARRANAVGAARSNGNKLFKASQFSEACTAYAEGLNHDPYNSILLCNRAACLTKLRQWDRAVEDCTAALNLRPSYSKARLRRADCHAKMEKWEESVEDYEKLVKEMPEDEEVNRGLREAQAQLSGEGENVI